MQNDDLYRKVRGCTFDPNDILNNKQWYICGTLIFDQNQLEYINRNGGPARVSFTEIKGLNSRTVQELKKCNILVKANLQGNRIVV